MRTVQVPGLTLPKLGLGTWQLREDECRAAVERALSLGYRHIDTAEMYGNERFVGQALAGAGVPRSEIHVTTKVWWEHLQPEAMRGAIEASLTRLGLDYVDLYLIHWPARDMDLAASLEALVRIRDDGLARAIGVSNFPTALLREAVEMHGAPIVCNQIEYHAMLDQSAVLAYARVKGIAITAYCPLAQGRLADNPALAAIARKHDTTAAQVALKWLLDQDGVAAIPKAGREASQRANLQALRVTLDDADRAAIAALPKDLRCVTPAFAPAWD